jgi:chromosome partitioning protein
VLLVDLDPQASLSVAAGVPVADLTASVYHFLLDETVDAVAVVHRTASGVDILPSTIDLAGAEIELVSVMSRELVLKNRLTEVRRRYDHVLIDCPPSLGLLTVNALAAADRVLIPMQCDFLATRGLVLLVQTIQKIRRQLNRNLQVAGILPTMFDGRLAHANEVLDELRDRFPDQVLDAVIKYTVRLKEAAAGGVSLLDYDRRGEAAQAFRRVAEVLDRG